MAEGDEPIDTQDGGMGPGLAARGNKLDWPIPWAFALALVGWIPVPFWAAAIGTGYFGPLQVPSIFAMVGVLFAVIAIVRSADTGDVRSRKFAFIAGSIALIRLFILPFGF